MARFYFHLSGAESVRDAVGEELADVREAQLHAVRRAGHLMQKYPDRFWDAADWKVTATDEAGLTLFTLTIYASVASALYR